MDDIAKSQGREYGLLGSFDQSNSLEWRSMAASVLAIGTTFSKEVAKRLNTLRKTNVPGQVESQRRRRPTIRPPA